MAKEGMSIYEIKKKISVLKGPKSKINYLRNILKKEKVLSPGTVGNVRAILEEARGPKAGMTIDKIEEKLSGLKNSWSKIQYLKNILKKEKLLKYGTAANVQEILKENYLIDAKEEEDKGNFGLAIPSYMGAGMSKEDAHMKVGKIAEEKGEFLSAGNCYKEAGSYIKAAKAYEKEGYYSSAVDMYVRAGMKKEKAHLRLAKVAERLGKFHSAASFYEDIGMKENAKQMLEKEQSKKNLEKIVTALMTLGGLGLIFSSFSKSQAVTISQQLAPPLPDFLPYVFAAIFIGGIGYFLVKRFKK